MASVYLSSDHHFFHEQLLKYVPTRPENYNTLIFENHNLTVTDEDIWICLGDLSAGLGKVENGKEKLHALLYNMKGKKKILIRGNHDYYQDGFYKKAGFDVVTTHMILGEYFICHYALEENEYTKPIELELLEIFKQSGCTTLIHGHTHCRNVTKPNLTLINTCLDANNYFPILAPFEINI